MLRKAGVVSLALCLMLCLFTACGEEESERVIQVGANVSIEMAEATFEEGTTVTAQTVTAGETYERAKTAVVDVAQQFTVFEINAVKDNATVQPNGKLAVSFPIPEDFSTNVTVYYVADDGAKEELATTVDESARTATAELSHFSVYVLAEKRHPTGADAATTTTETTAEVTTTTAASATTTTTTTATATIITTTTTKPFDSAKTMKWSFSKKGTEELDKWILNFAEMKCSYMAGMSAEEMGMTAEDIQNYPDDFELFEGVYYHFGRGATIPLSDVAEAKTTVTVTDADGKTVVLQRTANNTLKVISNESAEIGGVAGDVYTAVK